MISCFNNIDIVAVAHARQNRMPEFLLYVNQERRSWLIKIKCETWLKNAGNFLCWGIIGGKRLSSKSSRKCMSPLRSPEDEVITRRIIWIWWRNYNYVQWITSRRGSCRMLKWILYGASFLSSLIFLFPMMIRSLFIEMMKTNLNILQNWRRQIEVR